VRDLLRVLERIRILLSELGRVHSQVPMCMEQLVFVSKFLLCMLLVLSLYFDYLLHEERSTPRPVVRYILLLGTC
jgi:energy-converting hydrogenase Eha subunit F